MNNPTYPKNIVEIPGITFQAIKNAYSDNIDTEVNNNESITSLPLREADHPLGVYNPNFLGINTPNVLNQGQEEKGLLCKPLSIKNPLGIFQFLGVDYIG